MVPPRIRYKCSEASSNAVHQAALFGSGAKTASGSTQGSAFDLSSIPSAFLTA